MTAHAAKAEPASHIRLDGDGVAWIDDTRVKVLESSAQESPLRARLRALRPWT